MAIQENACRPAVVHLAGFEPQADNARKQFGRAIALDPSHANNSANFAGFLLAHGDLSEAERQILDAWKLVPTTPHQIGAEVAFYRCLCLRLQKKNDTTPLGYLKQLFILGFRRHDWGFDEVLSKLTGKLSPRDVQFYTALSQAILDAEKVEGLSAFDQWHQVKPIPLAKEI